MRRGEVTRAVSTEVDGRLFGDSFRDVDPVIDKPTSERKVSMAVEIELEGRWVVEGGGTDVLRRHAIQRLAERGMNEDQQHDQ